MSLSFKIPERGTIILCRPDRIGDVVITSACFEAIRKKYPFARVYLLARGEFQPLFEHSKNLTGFLPMSEDKTSLVKIFQSLKPDIIIHFHPHRECYRAACKAKIFIRIGWEKFFWTCYLTHALPDTRKEGKKHEGFYNFDLLQEVDVQPPEILYPEIQPANDAKESLARKLPWDIEKTNFIVLNPTTAREIRRWPTHRFAELAKWIEKELKYKIVSIGALATDSIMLKFHYLTRDIEILHLEGKLDLAELAWLLQKSKLLVTCDTGPSHIAAAMKCPQITIFGRNESAYGPMRWGALSEKVEILTPSIQKRFWETRRQFWKRGFENISLEQVQGAVKKIL